MEAFLPLHSCPRNGGSRMVLPSNQTNSSVWTLIHTIYTYPIYIKLACMIRMITLILPLCCLFNPERHELARGIYIIREVYIAMFVIRIIQLTIAFNHSYHTCKFDIDWISILLKISKINANFDIIAACSSSPSLLLLPFASCS